MRNIPNILVEEFTPASGIQLLGQNREPTGLEGYLNEVYLRAKETEELSDRCERSLKGRGLWLVPQKEGKGINLFVSGENGLIGITYPEITGASLAELKNVFFTYCNVTNIVNKGRRIALIPYYLQPLVLLTGAFWSLYPLVSSMAKLEEISINEGLGAVAKVGASLAVFGILDSLKNRAVEKIPQMRFSPKRYAGLDVFHVRAEQISEFFRDVVYPRVLGQDF